MSTKNQAWRRSKKVDSELGLRQEVQSGTPAQIFIRHGCAQLAERSGVSQPHDRANRRSANSTISEDPGENRLCARREVKVELVPNAYRLRGINHAGQAADSQAA